MNTSQKISWKYIVEKAFLCVNYCIIQGSLMDREIINSPAIAWAIRTSASLSRTFPSEKTEFRCCSESQGRQSAENHSRQQLQNTNKVKVKTNLH